VTAAGLRAADIARSQMRNSCPRTGF
jgi:hypothetical protein